MTDDYYQYYLSHVKARKVTCQPLSLIRQTGRSRESNLNPWFTRHRLKTFCGFPWVVNSNGPGGFNLCVYYMYMTGAPKGSTESISGEAGNQTCDPLFTRHSAYPLQHGGFNA